MRWNPSQYEKFKTEREQPFHDLVALLDRSRPPQRVLDLGAGTGALTQQLHLQLGARHTLGVDSSAAMLERARSLSGVGLEFRLGRIEDFDDAQGFDLVFSNAALHWVSDHEALFARLRRLLRPGGQLAVQMPNNEPHATHQAALSVATREPFRSALAGNQRVSPLLPPEAYAECLHSLGFADQKVRLHVYGHALDRADDVVEWVAGSLLLFYEERLEPQVFQAFRQAYRTELLERLNLPGDAACFLTYRRLLLWGALLDK